MIHMSVPKVESVSDGSSSDVKYNAFSIHINGAYHASIRYSQLRRLHEILKTEFSDAELPDFPPKKIRHLLSEPQLELRRLGLHKYLQTLAQSPVSSTHPKVLKFFLEAQKESFRPSTSNVSFDVFQTDGKKQSIRCSVESPTSVVLQIVCHSLGVKAENAQYFSLFMVKQGQTKGYTVVRWLKDFESPYISLQNFNQRSGELHKIFVRKSFWDLSIETQLLEDSGALNLLFVQAVNDVNSGWIQTSSEVLQRLRILQQEKSPKEYLKLCAIQKHYGYVQLNSCLCDYPKPDIRVDLSAGNRQIVISYPSPSNGEPVESVFRVIRIRGWKLINQPDHGSGLVFTFEYLMARDHFEWITLQSDQSVLLSLYLQSMGAEILKAKGITPISEQRASVSPKVGDSVSGLTAPNGDARCSDRQQNGSTDRYESFREVFNAKSTKAESICPVSNDAFDTITDEDL